MKLNSLRTMESISVLADDNNNDNNNSMLLNNSGPPAWILKLRDMDLDPPKLIRGNMEVIIQKTNTNTNPTSAHAFFTILAKMMTLLASILVYCFTSITSWLPPKT